MQLKSHERLDDLQIKGLHIIQDKRGFCFGVDAVLLSAFPEIKKGDRVLDMCTGNGIIPLLLYAKYEAAEIYGMEIQPEVAQMAQRSVLYNGIDNVFIKEGDIKDAVAMFGTATFDQITCNPPYIKSQSGLINPGDSKAIARHEILCTLDDVIKTSASLLRFGGKLCMVHRPDRLSDVISTMRKYKIEPKRLRTVHSRPGEGATLFLIEGALGGGTFLKVLPPLYIYDGEGNYTDETERIYKGI